ncbi:MAG: SUMF1/EgtB/PvdO family nonheme iron enzyme [Candidatus Aminicenantes bacterium]|nr:SUMF1/EgtB/PvdO family nonheme iron enzyme [Candidatus Aminicenantes bacterium]NIM84375.1 SUMF1/EgtB/PvdO family nonheme iron enzyme [Candidatus Aminicenantes bacterium]NIN23862.1 SUMF1/EgtB/PvdO family nonheme iron enzyme [Candidatus Aminicenantes bacterium]NIN47578.1 SUMF1/EgtB/PvdO family nonheme iron enzyme [Candidatus Aminicenantes bacterium]NIN90498.1 SUMF1/EgtB/PvdO family nonheme iron enzyme [Candidatus Aminicenantes bacterium]
MSEITILHLSDIHFKTKGLDTDKSVRRQVGKHMMETIETHVKENRMIPDVVAVTGDIAYSGKEDEYTESLGFFAALQSFLPSGTLYLAVPGNHDVDRKKIRKSLSLHETVRKGEIDEFLENKEERVFFVNPKFNAFRVFMEKLHSRLYPAEADYFWVKDIEEKGVSFLGLNSCWACEGDEDKGNITLGFPQVTEAFEQAKMPHQVLLMHHPPNWFNEDDFIRYEGEIFKRCSLILHGHTHWDKALVVKNPSYSCICLGANASYTDERKSGFIGFQFVRVEFRSEGVAVKVWPYRWESRDSLRFIPDAYRYEGQEGKPFFELDTFERTPVPKPKPVIPLEIPGKYKEWVKEFFSTMDIDLLARKGEVITVSLPELYIPIETRNPFYKEKLEKEGIVSEEDVYLEAPRKHVKDEKSGEPPAIDIEVLLGRKDRILLRGGAGTGKTTLIKHLAYTVTHDICPAPLRGYLPVIVFLKDLWLVYHEEIRKDRKKMVFEDLLVLYLNKTRCPLAWDIISAYLSQQNVLFLIDGLDEVPDHLRKDLVNIIKQFQFENKKNRFLLTGRPHGIAGAAASHFGTDIHDIEPLNRRMVEDFIKKWFKAVSGMAKGVGEVTAGGMLSDISQHEHISVFTQNPLLLTAVCILYQDGKRIPDQRADLYNRIIDNLVHRRFHDPALPGKENQILEFLMHLAFNAQEKNRKTFEKSDALESLRTVFPLPEGERKSRYETRILNLLDEIEPGCGLFNRLSSGDIEFTHLTFQEFLAAKHMVYMGIDWKQYLEKQWWEETLLLYTGFMSIDRKRESNAIVGTILAAGEAHKRTKSRLRLQLLAGKALCDLQPSKREPQAVSRLRDTMYRLMDSKIDVKDRFQAGVLAGGLGDTRIHPDNMVRVPAGEFIRGSDEFDREKPVRRIDLNEFMIGTYPVTNHEFKAFVDDDGYKNKEYWTEDGWQWRKKENISKPLYWHDREWNGPNFPVVGVSWYEASAYAEWLSRKTSDKYVLPTEAQWEKAARGNGGFSYPWGNTWEEKEDRCNWFELGLRRTSPVGIFPAGASPYGCMDMAGNVWEWCADWFDEDYYKESPDRNPKGPKDGSNRVIRGGGWGYRRQYCRASYRYWSIPVARDAGLGFRLARLL